jgi:peptide deformylase
MKPVHIIQEPNETLRVIAPPVSPAAIKSEKIQTLIKALSHALAQEEDGIAIAAPQIGASVRMFVVSKKVIRRIKGKEKSGDLVFINPEIVRLGKKKEMLSEGCLSVRWKYGVVKRSVTATVRAINERGHAFVMSGHGLLAQIFQHEIDHLDGILFIDKAKHIKDIPPTDTQHLPHHATAQ